MKKGTAVHGGRLPRYPSLTGNAGLPVVPVVCLHPAVLAGNATVVKRDANPGGDECSSRPRRGLSMTIEQHYLAIKLFARPRFILDAAVLWGKK